MDEAQYLAGGVAVIAKGEIVAEGPPDRLAGRDRQQARIRFRLADDAPEPPDLGQRRASDGTYEIDTDDPARALHELTGWSLERGVSLDGLRVDRPTLEDVYLDLTGGEEGSE